MSQPKDWIAVSPSGGRYKATPDTLADGEVGPLLVDEKGRLQVGNAAGEAHIGEVDGWSFHSVHTFTRPANTDAYTIGDRIGPSTNNTATTAIVALSVPIFRANGKASIITRIRVSFKSASFLPTPEIHIYQQGDPAAAPNSGTAIVGDNAGMTRTWDNLGVRVGSVVLPACVAQSDHSASTTPVDFSWEVAPASGSTDAFLVITIAAGSSITPTSAMDVRVDLWGIGA